MLSQKPEFSEQGPPCQLFEAYPVEGRDYAVQFFHLAPEHRTNATQLRCFLSFCVEWNLLLQRVLMSRHLFLKDRMLNRPVTFFKGSKKSVLVRTWTPLHTTPCKAEKSKIEVFAGESPFVYLRWRSFYTNRTYVFKPHILSSITILLASIFVGWFSLKKK